MNNVLQFAKVVRIDASGQRAIAQVQGGGLVSFELHRCRHMVSTKTGPNFQLNRRAKQNVKPGEEIVFLPDARAHKLKVHAYGLKSFYNVLNKRFEKEQQAALLRKEVPGAKSLRERAQIAVAEIIRRPKETTFHRREHFRMSYSGNFGR